MNTNIPSAIPEPNHPDASISEVVYEADLGFSNKLGQSPYHTVYEVELPDGTPMAVKTPKDGTLLADEDPELMQEAEQWAKFADHDYVVGLYDDGRGKAGTPYIAMELMDTTLEEYILNGEIGPLQQRLWILDCLCEALESAHGYDVAHRDLKPTNIMFRTVEKGWDVPKIGDWGSAADVIQGHNNMVSPKWAAPEQPLDNDKFEYLKKVDVYQFGLIMYFLLTDAHPLPKWSNEKPPKAEYEDLLRKPSAKRAGINSELDALTMDCLAYEPEVRPVTAKAIHDRLEVITAGLFD